MNGWMDGLVDGWMFEWVNALMDGWNDGWMDCRMDGWIDRQTDIKTNGGKDGRMVGRKNDFITGWIAKGLRERATDRSVMFGNNLIIFIPL
jgi:hypothetical protein